ncbi:MAG TPA: hypothetical protein VII47_06715, partial [Actinomycetota bacterium]
PPPCHRRLDLELAWKPRCRCGFALGLEPPSLDRDALIAMAHQGFRQHLAELARPEHLGRLEQAVSDLASLGRVELADSLRRLVSLVAKGASAGPVAVSHLLDRDLISLLGDVLSGSQVIVQRDLAVLREDLVGRRYPKRRLLDLLSAWVDSSGELPAAGFVEVIDGSERAGSAAEPAEAAFSMDPTAASPRASVAGRPAGPRAGATAAFLSQRFPRLAGLLPAERAADAFWLAAWWADRPSPPAWLPARLLAEGRLLATAAQAARVDPGALAELADLDCRVGPDSLLGDRVAAALDLAALPATDVAAVMSAEQLLRHPLRLSADELVRRLAGDWGLAERLEDLDPARVAAGHALCTEADLAPLGLLLEAARHLAAIERRLGELSCRQLVEDVYPAHHAAVPELISRAELACAGGCLISPETIDAFRRSGTRLLHASDAAFKGHAESGFQGCLKIWDVGREVLAPLLEAHGRVAVLLVDAMRADVWRSLGRRLSGSCPRRPMQERWAVVPEPTRTAEAVASLYLGHPVPGGSAPSHTESRDAPFGHLGYESAVVVGADRDHRSGELRNLWTQGPPVSVAVATALDERLHRTSVELAALLQDVLAGFERRILPSLAALPDEVPLVVIADHGFRENPSWGRGPEGRYVHGGLSLQESVVPVAVLGVAEHDDT